MDLIASVIQCYQFNELYELSVLIDRMCVEYEIEGIIPTSGAENLKNLPAPLIGTDPEIGGKFQDKRYIQEFFENLSIPIPPLCNEDEYPAMLKPVRGSGGWRNTIVRKQEDIRAWQELFPEEDFILQRIIEGIPASVCCVGNGEAAKAIAVNQQIMREKGPYRFGFSGSITPFDHRMVPVMIKYAECAAAASGCRGILGIDFIVQDDSVYAIELNPRFVATLDTIERATGVNLFSLHVDACRGDIPSSVPLPVSYSVRKILFADKDIRVISDIGRFGLNVADIPLPLSEIEEGGAIISVFGKGYDRVSSLADLDTTINSVTKYIG